MSQLKNKWLWKKTKKKFRKFSSMFQEKTLQMIRELKPFPADNDSDVYYHLHKKGIFPWARVSFKRWIATGRKYVNSMLEMDVDFEIFTQDMIEKDKWKIEFAMLVDTIKSTNLTPIKAIAYQEALSDPRMALEYLKLHKNKDVSIVNQNNTIVTGANDLEDKSLDELAEMLLSIEKQLEVNNDEEGPTQA